MIDVVTAVLGNTQEAVVGLTRANATSEYDRGYNDAIERINAMMSLVIIAIKKVDK